jgi:hypothetical protein
MQSALLMWDELRTIVPYTGYSPPDPVPRGLAEAWELIGHQMVPSEAQKARAHDAIVGTLEAGIPNDLSMVANADRPSNVYEIWPQKLSVSTWDYLQMKGMTAGKLPNGDYPFLEEGGLLVMAKLAEACAGKTFARVTDRALAYGFVGDGDAPIGSPTEIVPLTLELIDSSTIPIEALVHFRQREERERDGYQLRALRHNYADRVSKHIVELGEAKDAEAARELNRAFRSDMHDDFRQLRDEIGTAKIDIVAKPIAVAVVAAVGSWIAGATGPQALAAGLSAAGAIGAMPEVAKTIGDFLGNGLNFSQKQKELMAKHPMAYMYALSRQ